MGQKILHVDLEHIKGEEIVNGNPQHCINLLQLIYQLSMGIQDENEEDQNEDDEYGAESSQRVNKNDRNSQD